MLLGLLETDALAGSSRTMGPLPSTAMRLHPHPNDRALAS